MSPTELMEAVERFQKRVKGSPECPHSRYAFPIADSFTCRDEITRERLEATGFVECDPAALGIDTPQGQLTAMLGVGVFFFVSDGRVGGCDVYPHPQTMGDVAFLLYRLQRPPLAPEEPSNG